MTAVYSSDRLVGDRRQAWQSLIAEVYASVDITISGKSDFVGQIRRSALGNLDISEVVTDHEDATRTSRHVARDSNEFFLFVLVRQGHLNVSQFKRDCVLPPGSFTMLDLSSPYTYRHNERTDALDLKIPAEMIRARIADPTRLCAVTRPIEAGLSRVAADFISSLATEVSRIPESTAERVAAKTIDLLGVLLDSGADDLPLGESAVSLAIRRRCLGFIESHAADPDLDPAAIAAAAGISVRYLHKIFQGGGQSVGQVLRDRRLNRCRDDLADERKARLSIGEIAYRNGFRSQAHFTTAFAAKFGCSPGDLRRQRD
jgi:AraC-like DNA-binding protein